MENEEGIGDIEGVRERRRSSFWKWTCGGCLVAVFLALVLLIVVWYSLKRWDKGESAWERIPPSARWAVECHDLNGFIAGGLRDPGVLAVMRRFSKRIGTVVSEASGESPAPGEDVVGDFAKTYESIAPYFTMMAPNIVLVGGSPGSADDAVGSELFIFFRPPMWLRLGMLGQGSPTPELVTTDDGVEFYMFARDGWLVVTLTEPLADEILRHWTAGGPPPLGPRPLGDEPRLAMALRLEGPALADLFGASADAAPEAPVSFRTPFGFGADAEAEGADGATPAEDIVCRFLATPLSDGWLLDGEIVAGGGEFAGALREEAAKTLGDASAQPLSGRDAVLAAKLGSNLLAEVRSYLARRLDAGLPGLDAANGELARAWLDDAWLAHADGAFAAYAAPAAAAPVADVPPLPVFSLGWEVKPDLGPREAGQAFTESLTAFIDGMVREYGADHADNIEKIVSYELEETADGMGGLVLLPPVLVNSARPAWCFPFGSNPARGWLGTDPSGVDRSADGMAAWEDVSDPAASALRAKAVWSISAEFREDLYEWVVDRWDTLPHDGEDPEGDEMVRRAFDNIRFVADAFPRGGLEVTADREEKRLLFQARIPTGRDPGK